MPISILHSLTIIAVFSVISLTTQHCRAQVSLPSGPTLPATMKFAMDAPEVAESPSRQLARPQENSYDGVYRCPGPPVVYADSLSEDEARVRNCRSVGCWVPCDHVPIRSWPLFRAREVMVSLIESLKAGSAS